MHSSPERVSHTAQIPTVSPSRHSNEPTNRIFLFCLYSRWMWKRGAPLNRFDIETDAAATAKRCRREKKECFIFIARVLNRNWNPRTARASFPSDFLFFLPFRYLAADFAFLLFLFVCVECVHVGGMEYPAYLLCIIFICVSFYLLSKCRWLPFTAFTVGTTKRGKARGKAWDAYKWRVARTLLRGRNDCCYEWAEHRAQSAFSLNSIRYSFDSYILFLVRFVLSPEKWVGFYCVWRKHIGKGLTSSRGHNLNIEARTFVHSFSLFSD